MFNGQWSMVIFLLSLHHNPKQISMRRILFAVLATLSALCTAQVTDHPVVKTQSGQVQGII